MRLEDLQPGDIVYAAQSIHNDGSVPGIEQDQLLARAGARGVLINTGHLEDNPEVELYLASFENETGELGPAIGCWAEDLSAEPPQES